MKILSIILLLMSIVTTLGFLFLFWGASRDSAITMFFMMIDFVPSFTAEFLVTILGWAGIFCVIGGGAALARARVGMAAGLQLFAMTSFLASSCFAFSTAYVSLVKSGSLLERLVDKYNDFYYFYYPLTATFGVALLVFCVSQFLGTRETSQK